MDGKGMFTFPKDEKGQQPVYIGGYKKDKRHGKGKMQWPVTGVTFEGEFRDGVKEG